MTQSAKHTPFIPASKKVAECTFKSLALGFLLGLFFAVGNTYLGLKVGMTISASIPSAVLSMGILRLFTKKTTILEHNIVQTIASMGEGLASGVIFTLPAIFFFGETISNYKIFCLSFFGGILGILFMIPMRRYLIVKEHGVLPFPEGTACAEILQAGYTSERELEEEHLERGSAIVPVVGIILGSLYKIMTNVFFWFKDSIVFTYGFFQNTQLRISASSALLGVGYIIGARIAAVVLSGGIIGWGLLIPLISLFGISSTAIAPATSSVPSLSAIDIWSNYVRYIGAGTVAVGGLYNLLKIIPTFVHTIKEGFYELKKGFKAREPQDRTDTDISLGFLIIGSAAVTLLLWLLPGLNMNFLVICIMVIFGFLFSAVSCITVGIVGSSSSPVSGIIITTVLITGGLFSILGWVTTEYYIMIISMTGVISVAICLAGSTSQDLKTGYILGSTPKKQQIAEIFGLILPALFTGSVIVLLNQAYTLGSHALPAPQATLLYLIGKGLLAHQMPITLLATGAFIGIALILLQVPVLAFGIGLYLPLELSTTMMIGGFVRHVVNRWNKGSHVEAQGVLLASGLVAGDAVLGVIIALLVVAGLMPASQTALVGNLGSLLYFLGLSVIFCLLCHYRFAKAKKLPS